MKRENILDLNNFLRSAAHWRQRAEEMRTISDEMRDHAVRAMMLRLAAGYDRLAKNADDETAEDSVMFTGAAA